MLIEEKYFDQDKNYLLKTVQAFSKESLIAAWVDQLFRSYNELHNPMGLQDDFILRLQEQIHQGADLLDEAYDLLAAVYRMQYGDNQLAFQWDGRSHMELYDEEWKEKYTHWIKELSGIKEVLRPVIKYSTQGEGFNNEFLKNSIRKAILSFFDVRMRAHRLYKISA